MLRPALICCPWCRYYVNAGNVPKALQWVPSASLIKQAFEGLCDNEFPGLRFDPLSADGSGDVVQGEQVRCLTHSLVLLHMHEFSLISLPAYVWQETHSSGEHPYSYYAFLVSWIISARFVSAAVKDAGPDSNAVLPNQSSLLWRLSQCIAWTQVLQRLGFEDSTVLKTISAQTRILLFNYWATYCILKARKPNFQNMEPV